MERILQLPRHYAKALNPVLLLGQGLKVILANDTGKPFFARIGQSNISAVNPLDCKAI